MAKEEDNEYQCEIINEIILVNTSPAEAYEAFGRVVWWGGGGLGAAGVVSVGDRLTLEGSVRSVPLGIHEEVIRASHPHSLEYTLVQKSIFPVSAHRGCVKFQQLEGTGSSDTLIVWRVCYTPYCCLDWLARSMVAFLPFFLWTLKCTVEKEKNQAKEKKA